MAERRAPTTDKVAGMLLEHKNDPNAHHAETHGADKHTDVTRELWLPANEGSIEAGNPNTFGVYGSIGGGVNLDAPFVYFTIKVPDDFVSFVSVKALWVSMATPGNMYWKMSADYASSGEPANQHTDTPAMGVTALAVAGVMNVQEPANPLTLANLALGDYLGLEFGREGSNALDTLDDVVYFYGLLFTYLASQ